MHTVRVPDTDPQDTSKTRAFRCRWNDSRGLTKHGLANNVVHAFPEALKQSTNVH